MTSEVSYDETQADSFYKCAPKIIMYNRCEKIVTSFKCDVILKSFQPISGVIEAKRLYFAYPNCRQHLVLKGLNFQIGAGKTVALVGKSGCGKSTIVQLLERFYDVVSGLLTIDGMDVRHYNIRHMRSAMALVGQEHVLFNLTIRENITYGLAEHQVSEGEIVEAAKLANIHDFIESLPDVNINRKFETIIFIFSLEI